MVIEDPRKSPLAYSEVSQLNDCTLAKHESTIIILSRSSFNFNKQTMHRLAA